MAYDFNSCTKGSECAAWGDFLGDSGKKISIEERVRGTGAHYFRILVTSGDGVTFSKFRRYSEFDKLKTALGDTVVDVAPFPPKFYLPSDMVERFKPAWFEERRVQLEEWLQKVMDHESAKGPNADELFDFLDPKNAAACQTTGICMPPDANKICNEDIHYFGIDVGEDKVRVWRRYSDFDAFYKELLNADSEVADMEVKFPEKLMWNKFIKMWESKLEERRQGLQAWLQAIKMHEKSAPGGPLAEAVTKFLNPEENKAKLSWDCLTEDTAEAAWGKMQGFYQNIKEGFNELTKPKAAEDGETPAEEEKKEL